MKKLITLIVFALFCLSTQAFAGVETVVSAKFSNALRASFGEVKNVRWFKDEKKNYTAKFEMKDNQVTAIYNNAGELLSTSRIISDAQLPLPLIQQLMKSYPDQSFYAVVEHSTRAGIQYFITLEGANTWTVLKVSSEGIVVPMEKLVKS
ncbi:hypothetical protein LX64_04739 [Chitinophaga skermanii]|uniref:PepSY-like beta-lactamase-inhibitor n=1 Tax=Chitinophaga skermanii TaxID=331697 RepID=A0A327Q4B2_9BACT|nr:hypothetical protein [Chitinophaga skermanii]RAI98754.1 hypothetical protein LX64_04739 [Chitinophaga skermanii]